jgi:ABC-type multidrug transport system permease subunit
VRRLALPTEFTARVLRGERVKPRFELASSEAGNDYDRFRASRAAYTLVADIVALTAERRAVTPEALAELANAPRSVAIDEKPAGERRRIPSGAEQSVPGTMTMFTMICLLTSGAIGIVVDRRAGLLRRLAAAPIARMDVVAGKWIAILALGLVQIAFGAAAGTWLFGVDWGPDLAVVAALLATWAAFNASAAVLLGTLARTEAQAIGAGVLGANVLSALGGCWWPIEVAPRWMQSLAGYLPTGWVMGALHDLAIFQTGPASALRSIAWLAAGGIALAALAARRFRFA